MSLVDVCLFDWIGSLLDFVGVLGVKVGNVAVVGDFGVLGSDVVGVSGSSSSRLLRFGRISV